MRILFALAIVASAQAGEAEDLLALHNSARRAANAPPLAISAKATSLATEQSRAQAAAGRMHHSNLRRAGEPAGENVAFGSAGLSAERAHQLWMNSPGHRQNLLNPTWRSVGFAREGGYWTAVFLASADAPEPKVLGQTKVETKPKGVVEIPDVDGSTYVIPADRTDLIEAVRARVADRKAGKVPARPSYSTCPNGRCPSR